MALTASTPPVLAAPRVALASDVFVERQADSGRVLQPASRLRPGDRVVTIVTWKRAAPGGGQFTVTNPLPRALQFEESADDSQDVSVDGGRTWGKIGSLRVGGRLAVPEDVTHVRWRVATPAPEGRIAYSAIVR
ncbi:hypothetical protein H7F51_13625 [Novosphingobium flavum]|uniref:DUF11 domain-containing protein n=2 Tax=Novosphingobium flavum TaxID=1778672 RepID=A0A7X1FTA6_9SPHN|nr:hypothetical protein [Novosphingobium flavum]